LLEIDHPETQRDGDRTMQGTVVRKSQGFYDVEVDGQTLQCALSNKLRKQLVFPIADPGSIRRRVMAVEEIRAVDPVAIGDVIRFVDAGDGTGLINEVLPRQNKLVRRAAGPKPLEQVIVANVDQVIAVFAATFPDPKWELLDRYLAAAESQELPAIICITKIDLADSAALADEVNAYERIGYPVVRTSARSGVGIGELREILRGRVSVLMGKSGVGKTSLLNAVQPELGLRVNAVSQITGKGKHTTTHLEMFGLEGGGRIVDTPGMREFALWGVGDADLAETFPEMRPFLGQCRFGIGCQHEQEPGCAIKAAVQRGTISRRRYESYLRLKAGREE
jgi:ribosome biogenesis GTPase / thiamine phosphate phosphatase